MCTAETVARLFRRDGLNVRGAGLALLLIADVCAAHGGTVDVHSSTGVSDHGTAVRMTFAHAERVPCHGSGTVATRIALEREPTA